MGGIDVVFGCSFTRVLYVYLKVIPIRNQIYAMDSLSPTLSM